MGPGYAPIVRPNQDTSHPNYATCGYCPDMGPGYGIYYGYCMHCESIDAKLDANGYCATEYYP